MSKIEPFVSSAEDYNGFRIDVYHIPDSTTDCQVVLSRNGKKVRDFIYPKSEIWVLIAEWKKWPEVNSVESEPIDDEIHEHPSLATTREEGWQQGVYDTTLRYADLLAAVRTFLKYHDEHGWAYMERTHELGPKWLGPVRRAVAEQGLLVTPEVAAELADTRAVFDLAWSATRRAIQRWQAANPGNDHVWPDAADLEVWLMSQLVAVEAERDAMRPVVEAAREWRRRIHDDPNLWAGEEDFALIAAVDTLEASRG